MKILEPIVIGALACAASLAGMAAPVSARTKATPAQKCAATKLTAAGATVAQRLACYAAAAKTGATVSTSCLQKAKDKFATAFQAADAAGGCVTPGDAASMQLPFVLLRFRRGMSG
jgi:hypothetical protein